MNYLTIEVFFKFLHEPSPESVRAFLVFQNILTTSAIFVFVSLKTNDQCAFEWMR